MGITFFDVDAAKVNAYKSVLGNLQSMRPEFQVSRAEDILSQKDSAFDACVSPSNSFFFFDGGVDSAYQTIFPEATHRARRLKEQLNLQTLLGRPFVPVGSAIRVPTGKPSCKHLICVPTMVWPEPINGTENVYHAMSALLMLRLPSLCRIAVPCLGTGVGCLDAYESARQVKKALEDVNVYGRHQADNVHIYQPPDLYVVKTVACPQPDTYANTEIAKRMTQRDV